MTRRESRYRAQHRVFRCSECGEKAAALKIRGRTTAGHIKHMWCFRCKKTTEHVQTE